jgi:hypothetical protein
MMARFVKDVTITDGTPIEAGALFTKTWTMRNDSSGPWPESVHIMHVGGDAVAVPLAGGAANVPKVKIPVQCAAAGEEVNISVQMKAPTAPGRYVSYWRLMDRESNHRFGHRVWVDFTVIPTKASPTPPVAAAPEPAPVVEEPALVEELVVADATEQQTAITQEAALAVSAQLQQQDPFIMVEAEAEAAPALSPAPAPEPEPVVMPPLPVAPVTSPVAYAPVEVVPPAVVEPAPAPVAPAQWADELAMLADMGFFDADLLMPLLQSNNGDVQRVLEHVL